MNIIKTKTIFLVIVILLFVIVLFCKNNSINVTDETLSVPLAPVLIADNNLIVVNWKMVYGATSYEVFFNTINDTLTSTKICDTINTNKVIYNLINDTTYYVWIKAKNRNTTSGFSSVASCFPSKYIVYVNPANGTKTPDTRTSDNPLVAHDQDFSIPKPTQLSWHLSSISANITYDLYLSEDSLIDSTNILTIGCLDTFYLVYNLKMDWHYYWKVLVRENGLIKLETPTYKFTTPNLWPRMINIDGATNVRDIGGLINMNNKKILQCLLYRSSEFNVNHVITKLGIRQIMDLGIACEIDLRRDSEGAQAVLPSSIKYFRPTSDVGGLYPYLYGLQIYGNQYREVFKEIAKSENYPIILHCRAGADRTGTVLVLLEAILGCSYKQIALDYQWSSLSVYGIRDTTSSDWTELIAEIKSYAPDSTVQTGARNYLLAKGVLDTEIESIKKIFLEN